MKGSVVLLIGCFALFYTSPSQAYSVKFIADEDQIATRQDTQSESPSPEVAAAEEASQSVQNDTATDESKTVRQEDDVKPGDQSVQGDPTTEQSKNIRKRDTLSLVRELALDIHERSSDGVLDKYKALELLNSTGIYTHECYQHILRYLKNYDSGDVVDSSVPGQSQFTKKGMIRWLKTMQTLMTRCLQTIKTTVLPTDFDGAPAAGIPEDDQNLLTEEEMKIWLEEIIDELNVCFKKVIEYLERNGTIWKDPPDVRQNFPDYLAGLGNHFADAAMVDVGNLAQTVPPALVTTSKKRNFFQVPPGVSNIPEIIIEGPTPVQVPLPVPYLVPAIIPEEDAGSLLADIIELGAGMNLNDTYPPVITNLENESHDQKDLRAYTTLLDKVLNRIYAELKGKAPYLPKIVAAQNESLRVDSEDIFSLLGSPSEWLALMMGGSGDDSGFISCIDSCLVGGQAKRAASKRRNNK